MANNVIECRSLRAASDKMSYLSVATASESTYKQLFWTCQSAVTCSAARVAWLTWALCFIYCLKFSCTKNLLGDWEPREFVPVCSPTACSGFSQIHEAQMQRHSHARMQQLCLLQDRGQALLKGLQWKPGRHFMFHSSLNVVKKWKCQKGLVCQWLKWLWHEGTEDRQDQNNKKVSLKALLKHHFDRCAASH